MISDDKKLEELLRELQAAHQEIAELRAGNASLRQSAEKYRSLFEFSGDTLFLVAPDTLQILDANHIAQQQLGYTREELLAITLEKIQDNCIDGRFNFGETQVYECGFIRKDGASIPVEVNSRVIVIEDQEYIQIAARDISRPKDLEAQRTQAQDELRRLAAMIEQASESMVITDTDGTIIYANPFFEQVSGYTVEEALRENPRILKSGYQDQKFYREMWKTISSGSAWRGVFINRRKDGEIYHEEATIFPIRDSSGAITHYGAVKRDITARVHADRERERLISDLDAFAHMVAHDLKNPLAVVLGFASLLAGDLDNLPSHEVKAYLVMMEQHSQKMTKIINDLLLLSSVRKLDAVDMNVLDMPQIVTSAIDRLQVLMTQYDVEIILPDDWPLALGYGPWVEEVWANYISNAIKYGGSPPRVELGAGLEPGGMVRFWVRDNGDGIPADQLPKLFRQFSRLETTRAEGHGLGLSIVERIVEKLCGTVRVDSIVGQGSVFSFTLPAAG